MDAGSVAAILAWNERQRTVLARQGHRLQEHPAVVENMLERCASLRMQTTAEKSPDSMAQRIAQRRRSRSNSMSLKRTLSEESVQRIMSWRSRSHSRWGNLMLQEPKTPVSRHSIRRKSVIRQQAAGFDFDANCIQKEHECEIKDALEFDWARFDWKAHCLAVHVGSMKVVGRLQSHPTIAIASALRSSAGADRSIIREELGLLVAVAAHGIRTIGFSTRILSVASYQGDGTMCEAYLLQYFSIDDAFVYEEGQPGETRSCSHVA